MQTPRGYLPPWRFFLSGADASDAARPRAGTHYGYGDAALIIGADGEVHRGRLSPVIGQHRILDRFPRQANSATQNSATHHKLALVPTPYPTGCRKPAARRANRNSPSPIRYHTKTYVV